MKKLSPQLITTEDNSFPAFLTANSLKLRVMLDTSASANQFIIPGYTPPLIRFSEAPSIFLFSNIHNTYKKILKSNDNLNCMDTLKIFNY